MALLELNEKTTDDAIDSDEDVFGQYSPDYIAKVLRLSKEQTDRNIVRIASLMAKKKKTAESREGRQKSYKDGHLDTS